MNKIMNLVFVERNDEVLLAMKKRGFGAGRWNGFGGKVQGEETIEEAAIREAKEEGCIEVKNLEKFGIMTFIFENDPVTLEVHFFKTHDYSGTPTETEEMKPQWFKKDKIPFESMWPDDPYWFPLFLKNKKFEGKILFKDKDTITKTEIKEVEGF